MNIEHYDTLKNAFEEEKSFAEALMLTGMKNTSEIPIAQDCWNCWKYQKESKRLVENSRNNFENRTV